MVEKHPLTHFANEAELTYRNELQLREERFREVSSWVNIVRSDGYLEILPSLRRRGIEPKGVGLELGAGMSWLSGQISSSPEVRCVHALDISERLLSEIAPQVVRAVGGDLEKIRFHAGDFHDLSMFTEGSLDFVAVDAALHHTNEVPRVLAEVHRVLRRGGLFLAVNEPGVAPMRLTRAQSPDRFGEHERQFGIIENTFREDQWRAFFEGGGFQVRFIPLHHRRATLKARLVHYTPLRRLNGVLFWSKVIIAHKP